MMLREHASFYDNLRACEINLLISEFLKIGMDRRHLFLYFYFYFLFYFLFQDNFFITYNFYFYFSFYCLFFIHTYICQLLLLIEV